MCAASGITHRLTDIGSSCIIGGNRKEGSIFPRRKSMVLVTMEAHVPADRWDDLQRAYTHALKQRPDEILLSLLTQDTFDPTLWRILTAWETHEALEAYYTAHTTMPSMFPFHVVTVVPEATMSRVPAYVLKEQPQTPDSTKPQ
jgi:hypothetical protein